MGHWCKREVGKVRYGEEINLLRTKGYFVA